MKFSCLTNIDVDFSVSLTHAVCLTMVHSWTHVTILTLQLMDRYYTICSEEALLDIIRLCPLLQYVNVCNHECDRIVLPFENERKGADGEEWDEFDEEISHLRSDITELGSHLQVLRVDKLSEYGLRTILALCKHLRTLAILHAHEVMPLEDIFDTGDMRAAEHALHHLSNSSVKVLHLQNFLPLCDGDFAQLGNLEELCIARHSSGITNAGMVSLASRCPELRVLCMMFVSSVTPECFLPILDVCPLVTHFEYHASTPTHTRWDPAIVILKETIRRIFPKIERLELQF